MDKQSGTALLFDGHPKPGDTFRQVTVSEAVFEWRLDVDGHGDWYVVRGPHVVAQCPSCKELGVE